MKDNNILLSIAIPTWNRATSLKQSLLLIIPELLKYNNVELIVSNNNSTDNTELIIEDIRKEFSLLWLKYNKNISNIGYYGNFSKCLALAKGEYVWLLSDNDHLNKGVISKVIQSLIDTKPDSIYISKNGKSKQKSFFQQVISNDALFGVASYHLTLISTVVFKNYYEENRNLIETYKNNTLIGFIAYLNSLKNNRNVILHGNNFCIKRDEKISFNVFEAFSSDFGEAIKFISNNSIVKKHTLSNMINKMLAISLSPHFYLSILENDNNKMLVLKKEYIKDKYFNLYKNYSSYWLSIYPYYYLNKCSVKLYYAMYKVTIKIIMRFNGTK